MQTLSDRIWSLHGHKSAADFVSGVSSLASVDCELAGILQLTKAGWLTLTAPAAMVSSAASVICDQGVTPVAELGRYSYIPVGSPAELASLGEARIGERGKPFRYSLGRLEVVRGLPSSDIARLWYFRIYSQELQTLRRSYGLSPFPDPGFFMLPVAIRRKGVLRANRISKVFGELDGLSLKVSQFTRKFGGLNLVVETPRGECRPKWDTPVESDYGYIDGQRTGGDGEDIDCWINPDGLDIELVHVANQNRRDGTFDEHKVLIGFKNAKEARKGYLANYPKGFDDRLDSVPAFTLKSFKRWLESGDLKVPAREAT